MRYLFVADFDGDLSNLMIVDSAQQAQKIPLLQNAKELRLSKLREESARIKEERKQRVRVYLEENRFCTYMDVAAGTGINERLAGVLIREIRNEYLQQKAKERDANKK